MREVEIQKKDIPFNEGEVKNDLEISTFQRKKELQKLLLPVQKTVYFTKEEVKNLNLERKARELSFTKLIRKAVLEYYQVK